MDKSYDASKSEVSSEEEWLDLSKSDYAKVIFSNLYWNSASGDVGCSFSISETVNKNPSDYIGIYKVGYDDLSQCLAYKKLLSFEDESKPIHCGFKSVPLLNGFYQFLYVTHENEVCGASMPFEVKLPQKNEPSVDEVVTERIENDFLMVQYGLEQKNYKLETLLKMHESENLLLVTKLKELNGQNAVLTQKLDVTVQALNSTTNELQQLLSDNSILKEELKTAKANEASVLEKFYATEADYVQIKSELKEKTEEADELIQLKKEAEANYETDKAVSEACFAKFNKRMKENEVIIDDLNKVIKELTAKMRSQQSHVDIIQRNQRNIYERNAKDKVLLVKEHKQIVDQLNFKIERLTDNCLSMEKLLEQERAHNSCPENVVGHIVAEQLENKKCMIEALEDSKLLAQQEMQSVTEQLKKANKEVSQLKCENIALNIFLEEQDRVPREELFKLKCENMELKALLEETTGCSLKENAEELPERKVVQLYVDILMCLVTKWKELDPTVTLENLDAKLNKLIMNKFFYLHQVQLIEKFEGGCKEKDREIESLNRKLNMQERATLEAVMNAEEKTARILQAADLYKELYKEKEKLAKQLRKIMLGKSRSKKASNSKVQDNSQSSFLPLNIERSSTRSESTSNNSDSDTGEHVCNQILYPDLKKDENCIPEILLQQAPMIGDTEVKPYCENSSDAATVAVEPVYNVPSKVNPSLQPLLVEEDTHIPCLICGEKFLITPHSNIPMIEHIERQHNMDVCPMCGQMFDKSVPSKYLMFHINDHFQSE